MKHELPPLPYDYNALEPFIDAKTMELHHTKHHQTYVTKLNEALEKHSDLTNTPLEDMLSHPEIVPEAIRTAVRNHGGGHHNHSLFWTSLMPESKNGPSQKFAGVLAEVFGSREKFQEEFSQAAAGVFGSGWAWLGANKDKQLSVFSTPNQDSPLMIGMTPLLGLDVWEHAYYLNYQNRRPDYIEAWWHIINWVEVERRWNALA